MKSKGQRPSDSAALNMNCELCAASGGKLPPSFSHVSFMFCPSALCDTLKEDEEKILCSRLFIYDLKLDFVHTSISKVCSLISSTDSHVYKTIISAVLIDYDRDYYTS